MLPAEQIIMWGLLGGIIRIVIGIYKSAGAGFNLQPKRAAYTIAGSLFGSVIASMLTQTDSWLVALIFGFGGSEALDAFYRGIIGKQTGVLPPRPDYSAPDKQAEEYGYYLNERQRKGLDHVMRVGKITNNGYQRLNKCSDRTATYDLRQMVRKKVLKQMGRGRGTYYVAD
jgi:hypothetical protein